MTTKEQKKMNEALVTYQKGSQYQIMSQVCPARSLDQAFTAGWVMKLNSSKGDRHGR